jgi:DnaJ family protein C protein 13
MGHILPEAMVCYLENYSAEKFAEIFLGEFDTPEAIWNAEMRCVCVCVCVCLRGVFFL